MWAGANGCPLVRAQATRADHTQAWVPVTCAPFDRKLPPLLQQFRPDAVLLVLGPTELQEQRYAGDPAAHVAGDSAFTAFHDLEMAALQHVLGNVPLVVTDGPPVRSGNWATAAMASPARLAAWNAQVARWAARPGIRVLPYAAALAAYEAQHGDIRSDGVHPDVGPLTDLARATLVPALLGLVRGGSGKG
jgi:hypothetical protein